MMEEKKQKEEEEEARRNERLLSGHVSDVFDTLLINNSAQLAVQMTAIISALGPCT